MKSKVVKLFGDDSSQNKEYADLLNDFIKPFEHDFPDDFEYEDVLYFSMNAWNFGNMSFILPKKEFEKILMEAETQGAETGLIKKMVDLKIARFKKYNLFIGDVEVNEFEENPSFTVTTEQETEFLEKLMGDINQPAEENNFEEGYINRKAIIVKQKKAYFDWVRSIDDLFMSYEENEVSTYLVTEEIDDLDAWIKKNYKKLFEYELENEIPDKKHWPQKRSYKMFQQWFSVDISIMVYDFEKSSVHKTN